MYQTLDPLVEALKMQGIDEEVLERAAQEAERTGKSIRAVLIQNRIVTESDVTEASAYAYGMDSVDLVGYPIDPAAVQRIPLSLVMRHRVLGLQLGDGEIMVGITDPGDIVALDDVRPPTGLVVRPVMVDRSELRKVIDRLKREDNDLADVAESA